MHCLHKNVVLITTPSLLPCAQTSYMIPENTAEESHELWREYCRRVGADTAAVPPLGGMWGSCPPFLFCTYGPRKAHFPFPLHALTSKSQARDAGSLAYLVFGARLTYPPLPPVLDDRICAGAGVQWAGSPGRQAAARRRTERPARCASPQRLHCCHSRSRPRREGRSQVCAASGQELASRQEIAYLLLML